MQFIPSPMLQQEGLTDCTLNMSKTWSVQLQEGWPDPGGGINRLHQAGAGWQFASFARPFFFGASLVALSKKDGG